jgi:outer membrane lipoprotein carrier protein
LFYVDKATFQMRRVLMVDAQKNRNRFDFREARVNEKVPEGTFSFNPPPGTNVVKP